MSMIFEVKRPTELFVITKHQRTTKLCNCKNANWLICSRSWDAPTGMLPVNYSNLHTAEYYDKIKKRKLGNRDSDPGKPGSKK
jgi:hypothetical protein